MCAARAATLLLLPLLLVAAAAAAASAAGVAPHAQGSTQGVPWRPTAQVLTACGPAAASTTPATQTNRQGRQGWTLHADSTCVARVLTAWRSFAQTKGNCSAVWSQATAHVVPTSRLTAQSAASASPHPLQPSNTHQLSIEVNFKGSCGNQLVADQIAHQPHPYAGAKAVGRHIRLVPASHKQERARVWQVREVSRQGYMCLLSGNEGVSRSTRQVPAALRRHVCVRQSADGQPKCEYRAQDMV